MSVSFGSIALLCILSAAVLGFSIVFSFFLFMWCGCCHVSDDDAEADTLHRNGGRQEVVTGPNGEQLVIVPDSERRGIPLSSKAPKLTPEQEQMRERALEKYKRRKARQERRRERQIAREARVLNMNQRKDCEAQGGEEDDYDGASSVTSRTTLTSAATTVRTASTAAYGRGSYLIPPPRLCGANMDDDDDEGEELRSVHSHSSCHSTGTAKSQGTVATIKSYMRHRQRQRLRRREEQQQADLFNQWAEAQMASSSELSPSSKSSGVSSVHSQDEASRHHPHHKRSNGARNNGTAGSDRSQRRRCTLESSMNGGYDYSAARPRQRSSSVASSAPRPPEEILGDDHVRYSFMQTGGGGGAVTPAIAAGKGANASRNQAHLQAGFPATPDMFHVHPDFAPHVVPYTPNGAGGEEGEYSGATLPPVQTLVGASLHADPQQLPPPLPRRHRRTWKDVEHRVAMSGFFNSPANNSFGGPDATYDDGEAPAPFRGSPAEPSHSPLGHPGVPRE